MTCATYREIVYWIDTQLFEVSMNRDLVEEEQGEISEETRADTLDLYALARELLLNLKLNVAKAHFLHAALKGGCKCPSIFAHTRRPSTPAAPTPA
jgi:hypothetical protein